MAELLTENQIRTKKILHKNTKCEEFFHKGMVKSLLNTLTLSIKELESRNSLNKFEIDILIPLLQRDVIRLKEHIENLIGEEE